MRRVMFLACAAAVTVAMAIVTAVAVSGEMARAWTARPAGSAQDASGETLSVQTARLLKAMQGTWTITDTLSPDAKNPTRVKGGGTEVWRPGPGGYSAIEKFHSKRGDTDVTGIGMMWWDGASKGFHTIWCDSTNPTGCIDFKNAAHWEGSSLVLQEDYELNGKKFTFKEEFGEFAENSFKQTLYGGEAGHDLKVDEVIEARRK